MTEAASHDRPNTAKMFLVISLLLAIWLRSQHLTANPLWLDEAYSAFGAGKSFSFIWNILPGYETHPPLYSALLRSWTLIAGDSLGSLRLMGVLVGLATLPVIWLAARELALGADRNPVATGAAAVGLAALMPTLVETARSVRPYCLLALVYALGILAVLRLARLYQGSGRIAAGPWYGYLATLVLLVWLHSLGSLYAASLGLALIILVGPITLLRDHLARVLIGHLAVFCAVVPALLILFDQAGTWTQSTWVTISPQFLPLQIMKIYGLPTMLDGLGFFCIFIALFLAARGAMMLGTRRIRVALALSVLLLLPVIGSLILSLTISPVFIERTLMACSVPWLLLIAVGGSEGMLPRAVFVTLCGLTLLWLVRILALQPDQDWYGSIRWLAPKLGKGDIVYAYPNEGALPLRFALRDLGLTAKIRDIPGPVPANDPGGWYPTGSRATQSLYPWRLAEIANDPVSRNTPTIWLLRLNKNFYDPHDSFPAILGKNRTITAQYRLRGINIIGFAQPAPSAPKR